MYPVDIDKLHLWL